MKNIFDPQVQTEFLNRLEKLTPESKPLWGKMNASQMLTHCSKSMQLPTGALQPKPSGMRWLGRLIKKVALGERPLGRNSPTAAELKITNPMEFNTEKANFLESFRKLTGGGLAGVKAEQHPFFGKMSPEEWGRLNYKHLDHHFSQFGI